MRDNGGVKNAWRLAGVLALTITGACRGPSPAGTDADESDRVRIASFDFAESTVVAELYAQVLEGAGFEVERLGAVGPREVVAPALEQGLVDVVPEYLGSAAAHFGAADTDADTIAATLADRALVMLDPAPAEDVNVFVVTAEAARLHELSSVSDLAAVDDRFRIGGPVECPERPYCLGGLASTYGLAFADFVPLRTLAMTAEALERGEIDVGVMFSTAAALTSGPFVALVDDRELQPPDFVVPMVRQAALERWGPELATTLDELSAHLTTGALQGMNRRVQTGEEIAEVASAWLRSVDLAAR